MRTCQHCTRPASPRRTLCTFHRHQLEAYGVKRLEDVEAVINDVVTHRERGDSLRPTEKREAARRLSAENLSPARIAEILHVSTRTVWRWHAAERNRHDQYQQAA